MWCSEQQINVSDSVDLENKKPRKKRCPDCNKYLLVNYWACDDGPDCIHAYLPAHKIKKVAQQKLKKKLRRQKN